MKAKVAKESGEEKKAGGESRRKAALQASGGGGWRGISNHSESNHCEAGRENNHYCEMAINENINEKLRREIPLHSAVMMTQADDMFI